MHMTATTAYMRETRSMQHCQRVVRGLGDALVAVHGRHANELERWVQASENDRKGIVVSWITVEPYSLARRVTRGHWTGRGGVRAAATASNKQQHERHRSS